MTSIDISMTIISSTQYVYNNVSDSENYDASYKYIYKFLDFQEDLYLVLDC